jgi:type I restriction enzyme R subunit
VIVAERVEYLDENGKLVTESLRDFTKNALKKRFASLDDFLKRWKASERKHAIVQELEAEGLPLDPIAEEVGKNLVQASESLDSIIPGHPSKDALNWWLE